MTETAERKDLRGLARSIDALFTPDGLSPHARNAVREEIVWDDGPRRPRPLSRAREASARKLRVALDAFLEADPRDRAAPAQALRESAGAHLEVHDPASVAEAVERLLRRAGDPPDQACVEMAQVLLWPGVAKLLVKRLGVERDEGLRADLMGLCVRLGPRMARAISEELAETTDRAARFVYVDTLVAMGTVALPVAESMMGESRWYVVRNAVAILGDIGGEKSVELIVSALAHTDGRVRREALDALAKVGGEEVGQLVMGLFEDADPDVRLAAARAAAALRVDRALKALLDLLDRESDPGRVMGVVEALGQLGDPGAVNAIERRAVGSLFSRSPTEVRVAAYGALHGIATPRAKGLLVQAADDRDPIVRAEVRRLLRMR
jgi:hypothetical protein